MHKNVVLPIAYHVIGHPVPGYKLCTNMCNNAPLPPTPTGMGG